MQKVNMKKQILRKVVSISLIIILMSIGLNLSAYASITESTNTGSITVSGLEAGVTAYLYRLTTVTYNYTSDQPQVPVYQWVEGIREWIATNYPDYIDTSDGEVTDEFSDSTDAASGATTFYSELISAIKAGTVTLSVSDSQTTSGTASYPVTEDLANNSVTFTDCEMGTYLILVENGYRVYTPVVVNLTPTFDDDSSEWILEDVSAVAKSTTPQITKSVTDDETTDDNYSTKDTISYTIVADIPNYETDSLATTYKISDVLSGGLVLDADSIVVRGDTTKLTEGTEYELTVVDDLKSFEIEFYYNKISSYSQITVTYTAQLSYDSTTILEEDGNGNIATLTYSNNPYVDSSVQTQSDPGVTVYTYGIDVTKVNKSDYSEVLEGAEFTLSKDGSTLYFVLSDGVYYQANSSDSGATTTLVTDENGKLYIYGLDTGTYTLTETKAPDEYNLAESSVDITITDDDLDGILDDDTTGIYSITFTNSKTFQLPLTGGTGTVIFIVVGIVLIALGIGLIVTVVVRRKAK